MALELQLGIGAKTRYKNSGPGPQILEYGDTQAGFFGEVSATELFSTSALREQVGLSTIGTVVIEYPIWLKFIYKGKFLFIPKSPLSYGYSWSMLYEKGLVYGVDDVGPTELFSHLEQTNQLRVVIKDGYRFKVRLIEADPENPSTTYTSTATRADYDKESEWNTLFYRIVRETPEEVLGPKWADYPTSEIVTSLYSLSKTHAAQNAESYVNVSLGANNAINYKRIVNLDTVSASHGWRPVLELAGPEEIFSDYDPLAQFRKAALLTSEELDYITTHSAPPLEALSALSYERTGQEHLHLFSDFGFFSYTTEGLHVAVELSVSHISRDPLIPLSDYGLKSKEALLYVMRDYDAIYSTSATITESQDLTLRRMDLSTLTPLANLEAHILVD